MDGLGNYPSIYYKHGVSSINYIRICLLITRICTDLFRIILGIHISPAELRKKLDDNENKLRKKLNPKQIELIYPDSASSALTANDLDLSAMFKILRFVVDIQKHTKGWGKPPKKDDNSFAACLDRIKLMRDHYFHKSNIMVDDKEFQNTWDDLRYSVVELEKRFLGGDLFKTAVDDLCTLKIGEALEKIKQPEEKILGNILGPFFKHGGSNVRFATFLSEIAASVPRQKLHKMKEWIQTPRNGSTLVHVHVKVDINQSDIEKIIQTFVDIMHCSKEDVQVGGICPSTSFFLVLSIKTVYKRKLLTMEQQDKCNLSKLNIDYFIVDLNVVFLGPLKDLESKWKMYYGLKTERRYPDEDMHWKEGHIADHTIPSHTSGSDINWKEGRSTESLVRHKSIGLLSQSHTTAEKHLEKKIDVSASGCFPPKRKRTSKDCSPPKRKRISKDCFPPKRKRISKGCSPPKRKRTSKGDSSSDKSPVSNYP